MRHIVPAECVRGEGHSTWDQFLRDTIILMVGLATLNSAASWPWLSPAALRRRISRTWSALSFAAQFLSPSEAVPCRCLSAMLAFCVSHLKFSIALLSWFPSLWHACMPFGRGPLK